MPRCRGPAVRACVRGTRVGDQVRVGHVAEQPAAVVDDHDAQLVRGVPRHDARARPPAAAWSCRSRRREAHQVRIGGGIDLDRREAFSSSLGAPRGLPDPPGRQRGRRRGAPARAASRPGRTTGRPTRRRRRPRDRRVTAAGRVGVGGDSDGAASTIGAPSAARPCPGRAGTAAARRRSTSDSAGSPNRSSRRAAEDVLERRPQLAPPGRRHHQVQAVREPLRGERQQPGLQVVELAAQHEVAVDDEQDVGGGLGGKLTRRSAGPELPRPIRHPPRGTAAPAGRARPPPRRRSGGRRPGAAGP